MRAALCSLSFCLLLVMTMLATTSTAQEVRLTVTGDDESLTSTLSTASLTLALRRDGATAAQDYVAAARADYRRLLTGLYAEGHYGGTISIRVDGIEAAAIDPLAPISSVSTITLTVTPGPKFTFGRTDIAPMAPGTQAPEAFTRGQIAQSGVITEAAAAATDEWRAQGHALARPSSQQITADHPNQTLDVALTIDPGPKLSFGTVSVTGNDAVRAERIRAIAGLPTGTFDPAAIARAEANLRRTGAFSSANVIEADTAEGSTLPMTLAVAEQKPRRIGGGVEFSSVTGLTLSGFWLHRNLLGGAERLRVDGEITGLSGGTGGVDYSLGATFLRPATFRHDIDLYANALITQQDEPSFFQRDVSVEAGLIRRFRDDVVVELGLGFDAGELTDSAGTRSYSLLYLPIAGTLDRRDDAFDATSGHYIDLSIAPFAGFGQTGSGARVTADARIYRSFGENDRVTLAARGQLGTVLGADAATVPSDYLFYSGGGGTVRGQAYQSLSIDLGGGNDIGGTSFFGAQLEARVDVTDTIGVVGFYDVGLISADPLPFENAEMHAGAGLGLRYDTGIGPIRLDVATPTTGTNAGRSLEVYIGIGQAF